MIFGRAQKRARDFVTGNGPTCPARLTDEQYDRTGALE